MTHSLAHGSRMSQFSSIRLLPLYGAAPGKPTMVLFSYTQTHMLACNAFSQLRNQINKANIINLHFQIFFRLQTNKQRVTQQQVDEWTNLLPLAQFKGVDAWRVNNTAIMLHHSNTHRASVVQELCCVHAHIAIALYTNACCHHNTDHTFFIPITLWLVSINTLLSNTSVTKQLYIRY